MYSKTRILVGLIIISLSIMTISCSVFMAGDRSTKKNVNVIRVGAERDTIFSEIGPPDSSLRMENGGYKDIYKIDPEAHSKAARNSAVVGHLTRVRNRASFFYLAIHTWRWATLLKHQQGLFR